MLSLLMLLLPLVGMLLIRMVSDKKSAARVALLLSFLPLAATIWHATMFDPNGGMQFVFDKWWVESMGISFKVGMDGLSLLMVLLTNVLVPIIIFSTFDRDIVDFKNFYSLIFLMQFALVGVFTSLDGFLFYIFWELALLPIWFICLLWGGADRIRITLKFFIYTLSGSLFMLVALIYLYLQTPLPHTFSLDSFYELALTPSQQGWIFWGFFLAFAIKIPIFPLHTWQPDTYTNAPTQGTMLLSGIMLKMGLYGIIRWMVPVIPDGIAEWAWLAMGLSVVGIVYASAMAIAQKDFKRLIAYSSIAHVGLIAAGIFSMNMMGMQGAVFQMLSHGVNAVGLFFIADILIDRYGNREMKDMGGIAHVSSPFAITFTIILLGSVALPLTNGFVGEFMLLNGVFQYSGWLALFAGLTVIFGAVYMLRAYQRIMLGEAGEASKSFRALTSNEKILLYIIVALVIVNGVYPKPLLDIAGPSLSAILAKAGVVSM
ncbi:MAG: NADH-quinone oxidoreductase subunit M [Bacteroidetes bacterium]|nr:NADH-quinone oxidoreductase subunit M [Bacteroidota bacterium]MBK8413353.1 NADH-quinone oxidoreductase subunit M [Bacteroidota bacterium]MBK9424861.1 NADH-quinone oxidoreductase subunit M [Bacteroidota bacterium]